MSWSNSIRYCTPLSSLTRSVIGSGLPLMRCDTYDATAGSGRAVAVAGRCAPAAHTAISDANVAGTIARSGEVGDISGWNL